VGLGDLSAPDAFLPIGANTMDSTLEALFFSATARNATLAIEAKSEKYALAPLCLEILGLTRSVSNTDETRSWFATNELEWLMSRDDVSFSLPPVRDQPIIGAN
jgi:hypothetical protein